MSMLSNRRKLNWCQSNQNSGKNEPTSTRNTLAKLFIQNTATCDIGN